MPTGSARPELRQPAWWPRRPPPTRHRPPGSRTCWRSSCRCSCSPCWPRRSGSCLAAAGRPRRRARHRAGAEPPATDRRPAPASATPTIPDAGNSGYDVGQVPDHDQLGPGDRRPAGHHDDHAPERPRTLTSFYYDLALHTDGVHGERQAGHLRSSRASPTSRSSRGTPITAGSEFVVDGRLLRRAGRDPAGRGAAVVGPPTRSGRAAGEPESAAWWFPSERLPEPTRP